PAESRDPLAVPTLIPENCSPDFARGPAHQKIDRWWLRARWPARLPCDLQIRQSSVMLSAPGRTAGERPLLAPSSSHLLPGAFARGNVKKWGGNPLAVARKTISGTSAVINGLASTMY